MAACVKRATTGLKHASADLVAFLDADDLWRPDKIEKQVATLTNSDVPNCGAVYCGYSYATDSGATLPVKHKTEARGMIYDRLLYGNCIAGSASAVLARKSALDQIGPWDETLIHGEDWDYWLRLSRVCGFDFVPEPLLHITYHAASRQLYYAQEKQERIWQDHLKVLAKCERISPLSKSVYAPYYRSILKYNIMHKKCYRLDTALAPYRAINPQFCAIRLLKTILIYAQTILKIIKGLF
jgi:glycosyltransferase involved in cell wall biosynthesis